MILRGTVVQGLGIGRMLGYPTANIAYDGESPGAGVYAARCSIDGVVYDAVAVVGARVHSGKPLVEVLMFDFSGDLYGKELEVKVFDKISEIEKFKNKRALVRKIEDDIKKARVCLQELSKRPGA